MRDRLDSLDALRGLTIAAMLLVNNPGSWSHIYWPLEHAAWNGWTFTDLVFPFFLFMVGIAMMYSFPKRMAQGHSRRSLFGHVLRRALALMILGWWGASWSPVLFSDSSAVGAVLRAGYVIVVLSGVVLLAGTSHPRRWGVMLGAGVVLFAAAAFVLPPNDALLTRLAGLRIPGVLVRIGWCYALASAIWFLTPSPRAIAWWIVGLLGAYAVWMMLIPVPGFGMPDLSRGFPTASTPPGELFSNWAFYIDFHVFGEHTWSYRQLYDDTGRLVWSFDPEGLISTVPATCSVLFGVLTGWWMRREGMTAAERLNGLFVAGCLLLLAGLVFSIWMPINKRLWTSSYAVFTAGMALLSLGMLYWAIDMRGWRRWAYPWVAYGRNAIFAFVASGMMAVALGQLKTPGGTSITTAVWQALPGSPAFASMSYGLLFVAFWAVVAWLLDRRKVYFKV
jgi:predicted acyltransferase